MGSQQNEIFDEIVARPLIRWPESWQYGACGSHRKLGAALPSLVFSTGVPSSPTMPTRKTKFTAQSNTSPLFKDVNRIRVSTIDLVINRERISHSR